MSAYTSLLIALGWSLLDSIWQMGVLWTAYYFITAGNNRISAAGKHNLVILFVVFGAEWFVYTFIHLLKKPMDPLVPGIIPVSYTVNRWVPYLSALYLVILTGRIIHYGFHYYKRHTRNTGQPVSPLIQSFTDRFTRILGITKKVQVYLSDTVETAQTCGFFKPLIFLPFTMVTRLTPTQVEAILIHELYHIRRNDYLINIIMTCFRSVFFFNPFAHLFSKALEQERELACDDGVLELGYEPAVYAEALFSLEKIRQVNPGFSIAAVGNKSWLLMERIRRVLGRPADRKSRFNPFLFLSLGAAFILFAVQQKAIITDWPVAQSTNLVIPVHYEIAEEKPITVMPESRYRPLASAKFIKKKTVMAAPLPPKKPELISTDDPATPAPAFFAEENIAQNFSNQSSVSPVTEPVYSYPETPYIPSASLSYEALPEIIGQDSIINLVMQNGIKEVINSTRINTIIELKALENELDKNTKALKEIESKNRKLIILDQKNIRPLLKKLHLQMRVKKKEIDKMRIHLQVCEEEIIHI